MFKTVEQEEKIVNCAICPIVGFCEWGDPQLGLLITDGKPDSKEPYEVHEEFRKNVERARIPTLNCPLRRLVSERR